MVHLVNYSVELAIWNIIWQMGDTVLQSTSTIGTYKSYLFNALKMRFGLHKGVK